ncbi:hypothetical protein IGC83_002552 [Escherichia coli]|nr:hypothetical protein [Escherichia coli]
MNITKSAPLPERPCEQLTCCALCVCDPKHKHGNDSRYQAGGQCNYPLGSMPRRFSSVRPNSLSQLARLMPSLCASLSNCSFSSGEIRILNCGDCPSPLGLLSRLIVDKWSPIELAFLLLGDHLNTRALKKAKPRKCHYHSQGF